MRKRHCAKKSEELDKYFNNSLDLLCVADTDGYFRRLNPEWEKTLGYSLAELEGHRFLDFVHPDDMPATLEAVSQLASQQEVLNFVNRYRCKDGTYRWIEWRSYPAGIIIYAVARDITERKRAEDKLKASEAKFRELFESMSSAVAVYEARENGSDFVFKDFNRAGEQIERVKRQDIIGKSVVEVFPGVKDFGLFEVFQRVWRTGKAEHFPAAIYRDERLAGWRDNYIYKLPPGEIVAVYDDVTKRKQAEEEARQAGERLLLAVQASDVGLWDWNLVTNEVYFSPEWKRQIGYEDHEIPNDFAEWQNRVHPDDIERMLTTLQKYHENPWPDYEEEFRFRHKDGSYRWILTRAALFKDEQGKPIRMMGSHLDITERKQTEETIRQQSKDLAALLEISQTLSTTLDMETMLQIIVDRATHLMGLGTGAVYLIKGDELHLGATIPPIPPAFPDVFRRTTLVDHPHIQRAVTAGTPVVIPDTGTADFSPAERAILALRTMRSILYLPLMMGTRAVGILILATEKETRPFSDAELDLYRTLSSHLALAIENAQLYENALQNALELEERVKQRTRELEEANVRLQEVDRLKSVFLASMSHELRTPLNSIIGFTGIILQGMAGEINEEQRKQLTMVKNSANHLLDLINDVLDVSKIEAGRVELSPEQMKLDDVVKEVTEAFSPLAGEKGLKLLAKVPAGISLRSDKRRVKQVLMNLVSNAVKFTDRGSVKIAARIPRDGNVEIRIIDTGIGIKEEDMGKLFQPFQQIDISLTKSREGTGLGLHLARKLANLLGGDISAKSKYGKGSEFIFTVPLRYKIVDSQ